MTLKVLNIPYQEEDLLEQNLEISPTFNRDGWYYNSSINKCWIECNGRAFDCYEDIEAFKLTLFHLNCDEFRKEQKEILEFLVKFNTRKYIPKTLLTLVSDYEHHIYFRNLEKDLKLIKIKTLKNVIIPISV